MYSMHLGLLVQTLVHPVAKAQKKDSQCEKTRTHFNIPKTEKSLKLSYCEIWHASPQAFLFSFS